MGNCAVQLCSVLVVCLAASGGETETIEETEPGEVAAIEEPATSTPLAPTSTTESLTDTPVPLTPNPMQVAMTQSALTREIATPIPTLSIAEVQFEASWDGAKCIVVGPEEVPVGIYEFVFRDNTDQGQDLWMSHLREGHAYQDVLDYGKPGEWVPQPSWAVSPLMMREWDDDLDAEIVTISLE